MRSFIKRNIHNDEYSHGLAASRLYLLFASAVSSGRFRACGPVLYARTLIHKSFFPKDKARYGSDAGVSVLQRVKAEENI